ncbi:single-stranded-DNA-specific exonuclease RecJ [uncultured Helicobacter sp.]|uniref:single-stranded-DNA-specific exonuclease RecJ n=1 Tax=uncultured Helicobacter sp. TaxID=175537 RepID=UPI0037515D0E
MKYLSKSQIREILSQRDLERGIAGLADLPLPHRLKGVPEAAKLIATHMRRDSKILIVGDYDADGVNASAIMQGFFEALGYAHFEVVLPNRFSDGYGLSVNLLERLEAPRHYGLVITVDNGVSAFEAGEFCKAHNLALIITDHHTPQDSLPTCDVLINPKQEGCSFPFKDICGAMVAWYLCAGIKQECGARIDMSAFVPFVGLATLGDVMPLVGINRIVVKKALQILRASDAPFAQVLRQKLGAISAQTLSFSLIPLLNCAGRVSDARVAFEFLTLKSLPQALQVYAQLQSLNNERKALQAQTLQKAQDCLTQSDAFVCAIGEWHIGVVGIVCARLAQTHQKCAFVLSDGGDGVLKGSGRAYGGVNLIQSLQKAQGLKPLLLEFGGHQGAVGLQIHKDDLDEFMEILDKCVVREAQGESSAVLGYVRADDIDMELFALLEEFEPFGAHNPLPHFMCDDLRLLDSKPMGKNKEHLRLDFCAPSGRRLYGVEFFASGVCAQEWCFALAYDRYFQRLCLQIEG